MGACPFCKADISEDILLYGGRCPSCFNEIPGEEAPTDPGAQAQAAAAQEVPLPEKRSRLPALLAALLALGAITGGGWYASRPTPAPLTELPKIVINNDLSGHINPDVPDPDANADADTNAGTGASSSEGAQARATTRVPPTGGQVSARSEPPPQQSTVGPATVRPASGLDLDIGVSLNPTAAMPQQKVLSSDAEIQAMISNTLGSYISRLQGCYNTRLKEKDDLKGTWQVSFNVTTSGGTNNIAVTGRGDSDAPLEDCLLRQAERFTFQKIAREKPVSVPLRFGT